MKFKGYGIVWDAERNCSLCEFQNGELETEDKRTVDTLKSLGYENDGNEPIDSQIVPPEDPLENPPKDPKKTA